MGSSQIWGILADVCIASLSFGEWPYILYYYLVNGHILYYILKNTIAKSQLIHMFRFGCKSQLSPKVGFPNLPFVSNI